MTLFERKAEVVILLTIDCLRYDIFKDAMPNLNRLASNGLTVSNCFAVSSGTPMSMAGIMQSRQPTDYGGKPSTHSLPDICPTLAEQLSENGIRCGGWHSNAYTSEKFGYNRGFDTFVDLLDGVESISDQSGSGRGGRTRFSKGQLKSRARSLVKRLGVDGPARNVRDALKRAGIIEAHPHATAEELTAAVAEWLNEVSDDEPVFGWLHYMDLHSPYLPAKKYRRQVDDCPTSARRIWNLNDRLHSTPQSFTDAEVVALRALYRATALYVDDEIERLVTKLQATNRWEDTVIVVTADHGEMFRDRSIPDDYAFTHPNYLGEILTHVPLVFAGPPAPNATVEHVSSGMDVAPTIADLMGVDVPSEWRGTKISSQQFQERSIVYSITGRGFRQDHSEGEMPPKTVHAAARTDERTVLTWTFPEQKPEYYRRTPSGEQLIDEATADDQLTSLHSAIRERFVGVSSNSSNQAGPDDERLDEETAQRLRDLGYIE